MISVAFRGLSPMPVMSANAVLSTLHHIDILPCKVLPCPMPARKSRINLWLPCSLSSLCMYAFKLVSLPEDPHFVLSQCVRCIRPCKLHLSVASPMSESLVGNDVFPNSLTFTPYLKLGRRASNLESSNLSLTVSGVL